MPDVPQYLVWIEGHKTTVELIKWVLLIGVALLAGAFRFLRGITQKPKVTVQATTSRCLIEAP